VGRSRRRHETASLEAYVQETTIAPKGRAGRAMVPEEVPPPGPSYATAGRRREEGRAAEVATHMTFGTMSAVRAAPPGRPRNRSVNFSSLGRVDNHLAVEQQAG
jgi:hypothetical protein